MIGLRDLSQVPRSNVRNVNFKWPLTNEWMNELVNDCQTRHLLCVPARRPGISFVGQDYLKHSVNDCPVTTWNLAHWKGEKSLEFSTFLCINSWVNHATYRQAISIFLFILDLNRLNFFSIQITRKRSYITAIASPKVLGGGNFVPF